MVSTSCRARYSGSTSRPISQCTVLTAGSSSNGHPQRSHDFPDGRPLAADDRLVARVPDQDVHSTRPGRRDRRSDVFGRPRHDPGDPVHRPIGRDIPGPSGGIAGTGQLGREQRGGFQSGRQLVAVGPGPECDQGRRLAHAVADRGVRRDPQSEQDVGDQAADGDLAEDRDGDGRRTPGGARHSTRPRARAGRGASGSPHPGGAGRRARGGPARGPCLRSNCPGPGRRTRRLAEPHRQGLWIEPPADRWSVAAEMRIARRFRSASTPSATIASPRGNRGSLG